MHIYIKVFILKFDSTISVRVINLGFHMEQSFEKTKLNVKN